MKIKSSPWGKVDYQKDIAPGLAFVGTPSHGGFWLSPDRWAEFRHFFPTFRPFAGDGWLKEDIDYNLALLLWPEFFPPCDVAGAIHIVTTYDVGLNRPYFSEAHAWIKSGSLRAKAAQDWAESKNEPIKAE